MSHVSYAEPPAQGWDIHCHTVFSDGTETLRTLVEQARKLGLHGVAIADHDTTAGWDEATEASEEIDLPLLLGTEITAVDEDVSVHMLAFQYASVQRAYFQHVRQHACGAIAAYETHG